MSYFDEINFYKYIYLISISEPEDNSLRLLISAVTPLNSNRSTIEYVKNDKSHQEEMSYEVIFDCYLAYSIVAESFSLPSDSDVFSGRIFCIYERSDYLDYLTKVSFSYDDSGPVRHYGFNCLNHIVDVASTYEPIITRLA